MSDETKSISELAQSPDPVKLDGLTDRMRAVAIEIQRIKFASYRLTSWEQAKLDERASEADVQLRKARRIWRKGNKYIN